MVHGETEFRIFAEYPQRLVVAVVKSPLEYMIEVAHRLMIVQAEYKIAFHSMRSSRLYR